ncbi:MFS transporter [Williamsia muralis]|uniref:MFS transporter n=1 Tax=Williamsia marianensis TaxID=85044 RepID=UPI003F1822CB
MSSSAVPTPAALGARRGFALGLLTSANLLVFASVTIMNVALPDLQTDLLLSHGQAQGVVTFYSLAFGALLVLGGRLADIVGLRRCITTGLVGFAAASLLGGLAPEPGVLLAARLAQGAAGALVAATAVSLMSVIFPSGRGREIAFTTLGVVMGIGTAGSFVAGGVLVDLASWRWCLLVNVPIALLLAAGIAHTAPEGPRTTQAHLDVGGAILICLSLGAIMLGLDRATAWGWGHTGTVALLVGGAAGIGIFAATLPGKDQPLIPPSLLGDRLRVIAYAASGLVGIGMFAGMYVLTALLHTVLGLSSTQIGLAFLPFAVGAVVTTWALPRVRTRLPVAVVLAVGLMLTAAAIATFVALEPSSRYSTHVLPAMLLLGAGGTLVMITAGEVATAGAGPHSGVAGSLVNAAQQIGAATGTALLATAMTITTRTELARGAEPVEAAVAGYAHAGLIAALLLLTAAMGIALIAQRSQKRIHRSNGWVSDTSAVSACRTHPDTSEPRMMKEES